MWNDDIQSKIALDNLEQAPITEGYLESAYSFFAENRVPGFYLPPSDSWYIKAALRERFPDRLPPSVLEIEDILIGAGVMEPRDLDGYELHPPFHQWPPRLPRNPG